MEKILNSNIELDKVKIIVPNNRSILYLKKSFMDFVKRPFFSPDIQTIELFVGIICIPRNYDSGLTVVYGPKCAI